MNMANMQPEDVQKMGTDAGLDLPENAVNNAMNGDFSAFKNQDWS